MAEAVFYQLMGAAPETVLPPLLDRLLAEGWRVELRGPDRARMERLDLRLWGPGDDFRPHGLMGGDHDARQPVLLTWGGGTGGRDCLVALDGAPVTLAEAQAATRVCILFDGEDEAALGSARQFWKAVAAAGLPARYFERAGGGWVLRARNPR
jgi:DNA polymerase-3 subunit chi